MSEESWDKWKRYFHSYFFPLLLSTLHSLLTPSGVAGPGVLNLPFSKNEEGLPTVQTEKAPDISKVF